MRKSFIIAAIFAFLCLNLSAEGEDTGLVRSKTATSNDDGTYTLSLETYVTGQSVVTTSTKTLPVDVVLILDISGSMNQVPSGWSGVGYIKASDHTTVYKDKTWATKVTDNEDMIYRKSTGTLVGFRDGKWKEYSSGTWKSLSTEYTTQLDINGRSAVSTAACKFLDDLALDAAKTGNTHRVAIVTFASKGAKVCDFTDVSANVEALKDKVLSISYSSDGSTYPQYGFEQANTCLESARSDASKNVLFFTDGYPGTSTTSVNVTQANAAITKAVTTKSGKNATVFAVGYINNPIADQNTFMNAVSSNYLNATSMTSLGDKTGSGYYLTTNDVGQIVGYFETVTTAIVSGGAMVQLDASTIIKDFITTDFQLRDGEDVSKIETKVASCTGVDDSGNFVFSSPVAAPAGVTVTYTPKDSKDGISVTGYDFSANFVGRRIVNGVTSYGGQKLIINLVIKPVEGFEGGLSVATNTSDSGIYTADDADPVAPYTPPTICAPMDLIVSVTGMKKSESVVFRVTRSLNSDGSSPEAGFSFKVMLTGGDNTSDKVYSIINKVATAKDNDKTKPYYYTVATEGWEWAYKRTSGDTGNTHILSKDDGTAYNEFEFVRTLDTTKPNHGETTQLQIVTIK